MNELSGETTKGGFETTRSNRSPSTGSKKLPRRTSTFARPLSAALKAVYATARSLTSVATTCFACRAASTAWIPEPVPTSSARCTGLRTVRFPSRAEDGATPITDSVPPRRSEAKTSSPEGTSRTSGSTSRPASATRPSAAAPSRPSGSSAAAASARRTGCSSMKRRMKVEIASPSGSLRSMTGASA